MKIQDVPENKSPNMKKAQIEGKSKYNCRSVVINCKKEKALKFDVWHWRGPHEQWTVSEP
jgi:hypothetical protein